MTITDDLLRYTERLELQVQAARAVNLRGIELMDGEQVGQWDGVRLWLEQGPEDYRVEDAMSYPCLGTIDDTNYYEARVVMDDDGKIICDWSEWPMQLEAKLIAAQRLIQDSQQEIARLQQKLTKAVNAAITISAENDTLRQHRYGGGGGGAERVIISAENDTLPVGNGTYATDRVVAR